jgi:hypothetical protein
MMVNTAQGMEYKSEVNRVLAETGGLRSRGVKDSRVQVKSVSKHLSLLESLTPGTLVPTCDRNQTDVFA